MKANSALRTRVPTALLVACTVITMIFSTGCRVFHGPKALNLSITEANALSESTVQLCIGAYNGDYYNADWKRNGEWNTTTTQNIMKHIDELSKQKDPEGISIVYTNGYVLTKKDKIWSTWLGEKNADHLLVIAHIPPVLAQGLTPSKVDVPLDQHLWRRAKWIHIEIDPTGVKLVDTPVK